MVVVEALALLLVAFVPSHALHALADLNVEPWPGFGLFWMAEPNGKPLESHEKPWKPPQALKDPMLSGSNARARAQSPLAEGSPAENGTAEYNKYHGAWNPNSRGPKKMFLKRNMAGLTHVDTC